MGESERKTVYKRTSRASNRQRGSTRLEENHKLQSFIRELRVLGHLREHPNIVNVLGIAWEDTDDYICPILALEFAQLNSLPRFLKSIHNTPLTSSEKRKLTKDITCGLSAIHKAGFIWGDCKPENVLIFREESEGVGLRASLNDFGCSICLPNSQSRFIGFSEPWTAPEAHSVQGAEALRQAEIFSFGMLIWSLQMDGMQFHPKYWEDQTESSLASGQISQARIIAAKTNGEIGNVAVRSLKAHLGAHGHSKGGPRISKLDLENIITTVEATMTHQPEDRISSIEAILDCSM